MTRPVRLRLSRAAGFDLQAHSDAVNGLPAIAVARPGRFKNPFIVGRDGDRARCVDLHRQLIAGHLCLTARADIAEQEKVLAAFRAGWCDLVGHNLACWCRIPEDGADDICHASTLLKAIALLENHHD